jgi:hypothetical protein
MSLPVSFLHRNGKTERLYSKDGNALSLHGEWLFHYVRPCVKIFELLTHLARLR